MELWQILTTCLLVGIASAHLAKTTGRSPWFWGVLGVVFFGIIVHTLVGILVFVVFA